MMLSPLLPPEDEEPVHQLSAALVDFVRIQVFYEDKEVSLGWHINSGYSIIQEHICNLIGVIDGNFQLKDIKNNRILELNDLVYLPGGEEPLLCDLILNDGWTEELSGVGTEAWGRLRLLNGFRAGDSVISATIAEKKEFNEFVTGVIDELCCLDTGLTWLASERVILNCIRGICTLTSHTMKRMINKNTDDDDSFNTKFELVAFTSTFFACILFAYAFSVKCYDVYKKMLSMSRDNLVNYIFSPTNHDVAIFAGLMTISILFALFLSDLYDHLVVDEHPLV